jgi:CRISPR system Cascade subunit CasB
MDPYWDKHTDGDGKWTAKNEGPPGADLAALRRGIGREPGTVPEMWRFYTTLVATGVVTNRLRAEHTALTLFGVHQQSKTTPMHQTGHGLGTALRAVRRSDKFSEQAVDRRFTAAATATSMAELALHLRGLVALLHDHDIDQPLDYTQLFRDLNDWQYPQNQGRVRRRWGSQYFVWSAAPDSAGQPQPESALETK